MKTPTRLGMLAGGCAVAGIMAVLIARATSDTAGDVDALPGWPERISLTCEACEEVFQMASKEYLSAVQSVKPGAEPPFACPACKSSNVVRTESRSRRRDRFIIDD